MNRTLIITFLCGALLCFGAPTLADTIVTVDPGATWNGFMNVFELDESTYAFGSAWGTADLVAVFSGADLTLGAAPINDPDGFWYQNPPGGPGSAGNKWMNAAMYVEPAGSLPGQNVKFQGEVLSNSLVSGYESVAFIRDFAPDFSSVVEVTVPLTPGVFSIDLDTINDPARHVQYGFLTTGPNVWPSDLASKGFVVVTGIPEPASALLAGLALIGGLAVWRRR